MFTSFDRTPHPYIFYPTIEDLIFHEDITNITHYKIYQIKNASGISINDYGLYGYKLKTFEISHEVDIKLMLNRNLRFDQMGKLLYVETSDGHKRKLEYNNNGLLVKDHKNDLCYDWEYTKNGKMKRFTISKNFEIISDELNKYNSNGEIIERIENGKLIFQRKFKKNLIIWEKTPSFEYECKYDSFKNMVYYKDLISNFSWTRKYRNCKKSGKIEEVQYRDTDGRYVIKTFRKNGTLRKIDTQSSVTHYDESDNIVDLKVKIDRPKQLRLDSYFFENC